MSRPSLIVFGLASLLLIAAVFFALAPRARLTVRDLGLIPWSELPSEPGPLAVSGDGIVYWIDRAERLARLWTRRGGVADAFDLAAGPDLAGLSDLAVGERGQLYLLEGRRGIIWVAEREEDGAQSLGQIPLGWASDDRRDAFAAVGIAAPPLVVREVIIRREQYRFQVRQVGSTGATLALLAGVELGEGAVVSVDPRALVREPVLDLAPCQACDLLAVVLPGPGTDSRRLAWFDGEGRKRGEAVVDGPRPAELRKLRLLGGTRDGRWWIEISSAAGRHWALVGRGTRRWAEEVGQAPETSVQNETGWTATARAAADGALYVFRPEAAGLRIRRYRAYGWR